MIKLENEAEDVVAELVAGSSVEIVDAGSGQQDFTDVRRIQQAHDVQQGAFSGATLADHGNEFSPGRRQTDAAQDRDLMLSLQIGPRYGFSSNQRLRHFQNLSHNRVPESSGTSMSDTRGCIGSRHSNLNARTGCRAAARRAGRMLASTAMAMAPVATQNTIHGFTCVGISRKK